MKILRRGKKLEDEVMRGDCGHCGTWVEFSRGEAEYVFDQRDGDYVKVECPVCGRLIIVAVGVREYKRVSEDEGR